MEVREFSEFRHPGIQDITTYKGTQSVYLGEMLGGHPQFDFRALR